MLKVIIVLTKQKQLCLSEARKKALEQRKVTEMVEFLTPRKPDDRELGGRISGATAWRVSRGEIGNTVQPFVFILNAEERLNWLLHFRYNTARNEYQRMSSAREVTEGWNSCTFESCNVQRKVEKDWQMVYLARKEGSKEDASISWKIDCTGYV